MRQRVRQSEHHRFPDMPRRWVMIAAIVLVSTAACGDSAGPTTTRPEPETTLPTGEAVVVSPQFVQGIIPDARVTLLVSQTGDTAGEATVTAHAPGATVTVQPSVISGTEVAEVTVVVKPTTNDASLTITIEVVTADGTTHTATRTPTIVPWEDDRGEQAADILGIFTSWLAANRPELGVGPDTEFDGVLLAPELLVVSHYGFFNDQWEIGLAWHVMIPPQDFSEIYLRDRADLRPSRAFRVQSWQTALEGVDYEVAEVDPPAEVFR
jgi:hypothetical protein